MTNLKVSLAASNQIRIPTDIGGSKGYKILAKIS
ncbi:unnamed protein product [Arabidopsis thaliana]|uniref:(thale cress) hypothetical protein n=1 Tax=Arabidopsis thaliana TaxID=3702 RepID=A0A7G2EWX3_ARATH|nr:unnamed protein product [Arabidopsis thaliana]